MKSIRALLQRFGQMTVSELRARGDISASSVSYQIKALRDKQEVHICGWIMFEGHGPGRSAPIYALGNAPDVAYTPRGKRAEAKAARAAEATKEAIKPIKVCERAAVRQQAGMWGGLICSA